MLMKRNSLVVPIVQELLGELKPDVDKRATKSVS